MTITAARPLHRILGLGFGLALVFGNTVGVGILRLPGTLAAALGDAHLVVLFWVLGGLYALLGAVAVAELAAMVPLAGGFYVYARRAFGDRGGFVIGWSDWIVNISAIAFQCIAAASFLGALWAPAAAHSLTASLCDTVRVHRFALGWTAARPYRDRCHLPHGRAHAVDGGDRLLCHSASAGIDRHGACKLRRLAATDVNGDGRGDRHGPALGAADLRRLVRRDLCR